MDVLHSVLDVLSPVMVVLVAQMDVTQHVRAVVETIHAQINVVTDANKVVTLDALVAVRKNVLIHA